MIIRVERAGRAATLLIDGEYESLNRLREMIRDLDPDDPASTIVLAEQREAAGRFEMTRSLRFKMQEAMNAGNRPKFKELQKLLGEILAAPVASDRQWLNLEDGNIGAVPKSYFQLAIASDPRCMAQVIAELRQLRIDLKWWLQLDDAATRRLIAYAKECKL